MLVARRVNRFMASNTKNPGVFWQPARDVFVTVGGGFQPN